MLEILKSILVMFFATTIMFILVGEFEIVIGMWFGLVVFAFAMLMAKSLDIF